MHSSGVSDVIINGLVIVDIEGDIMGYQYMSSNSIEVMASK